MPLQDDLLDQQRILHIQTGERITQTMAQYLVYPGKPLAQGIAMNSQRIGGLLLITKMIQVTDQRLFQS